MRPSCGCCAGGERLTPAATANPPGLDALRYRVGTHGVDRMQWVVVTDDGITACTCGVEDCEHVRYLALARRLTRTYGLALSEQDIDCE